MPTVEVLIRIFGGLGLLAANAFFVSVEFAMTRVRQFPEEEFQESAGLRRAWEMTGELEIYLTACQVGITITSILLGVVFEPAVSFLLEPALQRIIDPLAASVGAAESVRHFVAVAIAVLLIQLMHTVWGEQTPTYLGVERSKQVAEWFATPLYWWAMLMYPAIYFGDHLAKWTLGLFGVEMQRSWTEEGEGVEIESRADLRRAMGNLLSEGKIPEEHREEILNAFELTDLPTREIMVPREEVVALSTEDTPAENWSKMTETKFSRYPVVGGELEDFVGIVYASALLPRVDDLKNGDLTVEEAAVRPMSVAGDCPVADLVDRFQTENQEMALVLDGGKVVGLVTLTDAFEAIMGEVEDPFD